MLRPSAFAFDIAIAQSPLEKDTSSEDTLSVCPEAFECLAYSLTDCNRLDIADRSAPR